MNTKLLAQITNPFLPAKIGAGTVDQGVTAGGSFISALIGFFLFISFIAAFIYLLFNGLKYISAGSEKAWLEEARRGITHAIIGLIIVAAVWAIMSFVGKFLGFDLLKLTIPTVAP